MLEIISVILSATAIFAAIMLNLAVRPHLSRKMIAFAATFTVVGGLLMYSYGYACTSNSLPLAVVRAIVAVCTILPVEMHTRTSAWHLLLKIICFIFSSGCYI